MIKQTSRLLCGTLLALVLGTSLVTACLNPRHRAPATTCHTLTAQNSYAVLISEEAFAQAPWRQVAEVLRAKYDGQLILYPRAQPTAALPQLQAYFPHYACFVTPPADCTRDFVITVNRLTRQLDDDPYGDLLWGILTGYEAQDALRIAQLQEPLAIKRAAISMGPGLLEGMEAGFASDENSPSNFWYKTALNDDIQHVAVAPDATRQLATAFSTIPIDAFYTSGHATERDWQIAYNLPGGAVKHDHGALYAHSIDGTRYPFSSPNPKVYLAMGNCLIGHIDQPDCMATAWLHSGGVAQMVGYTVVTFYGYMGWGTKMFFDDGRLSFSEAFFLNNQALLYDLTQLNPDFARANPSMEEINTIQKFFAAYGKGGRDAIGMLWDRDTVAFYGDPAWCARYTERRSSVSTTLTEKPQGVWQLEVTALTSGEWDDPKCGPRPLPVLLPQRLTAITDIQREPAGTAPLITDRFVLIPVSGPRQKGEKITVTFKAQRAVK